MKLFNRMIDRSHPYAKAIAGCWRSRDSLRRASVANLEADHRVSKARAAKLARFIRDPVTPLALSKGVEAYRISKVRDVDPPDFVDKKLNGINILDEIQGDVALATLLDLHRLARVLRNEKERGSSAFDTFPDEGQGEEAVKRFLDRRLTGRPRSEVREFVEAILAAVNRSRPFHPTWVMLWGDLEKMGGDGATRWMETAGVPVTGGVGHWVLALKYTVREAGGILYRPTILDAGWKAEHFPSPPPAPPERGGFSMDLRTSPAADGLIAEFVHPQLRFRIRHWDDARGLKGLAHSDPGRRLVNQRKAHWHLLERNFPSGFRNWMPRPV